MIDKIRLRRSSETRYAQLDPRLKELTGKVRSE
jgi:hypothetical protein